MALTDKQKAFVEEYLVSWNATESARRVGYKGDENTLGSVGYENLQKPAISKAIRQRLQAKAMTADEALFRLAEQARGSLADFADLQLFADLKDHPKAHLVKKMTSDVYAAKDGTIHHRLNIELHDSQAALVHIGRHHQLFTDRQEIEHRGAVERVKIIEVVRPGEDGLT